MAEEMKELNSNDVRVNIALDKTKIKKNRRFFKDKTPFSYMLVNITILVLIIFCGFKVYRLWIENTSVPYNVCFTKSCNETANTLLSHMNQSMNPCENFYDFVCGNANDPSKLTTIVEKSFNLLHELVKVKINDQSPEYLKKFQRMYNSCSCNNEENTVQKELKKVFDKIGGWPILNSDRSRNETKTDWIEMTLKCRKEGLPFEHFLELNIVFDSKNYSRKVIRISHPKLGLNKYILDNNYDDFQKSYKQTMMNVVKKLGANDSAEQELDEVFNFQMELVKISSLEDDDLLNSTRMTIGDLESKYPNVRWLDFLNGIISPEIKLDSSEIIYISSFNFIEKIYDLMTKRKPSDRVLINYVFWRLMAQTINHDPCDEFYDCLNDDYNLNNARRTMEECKVEMSTDMYLASDALYGQNVYNKMDSAVVKIMSENIRRTFTRMILKLDWLTEETKNKILERISQLNYLIGYPKEIFNNTKLNEFYKDLDIPEGGNYFLYSLNFHKFEWDRINKSFKKPFNKFDWTMGQVDHMPVYLVTNEIKIPAVMLDPLFFNQNFADYMNYGMIGTIIGHEMAHILSSFGQEVDYYGNRQNIWWDARSLEIYTNKTKCLIEKYNSYSSPEFRLNGENTLHENLADIDGLRMSYYTYVTTASKYKSVRMPGFEKFTPNQMFWIAFGSNWCEKNQKNMTTIANSIQNQDEEHSPGRFRVLGSMSSLEEFAKDFNCKPTDTMNPADKCKVW